MFNIDAFRNKKPNASTSTKRLRNPNWTDDEIYRFLELLQEKEVLQHMKDNRTRDVFNYISCKLSEDGREKTAVQCKVKLKNLKFHWRSVAERVPFLERANLENEADMMILIEQCERNGISSFNVRHIRMLKRFLDSLSCLKNGLHDVVPHQHVDEGVAGPLRVPVVDVPLPVPQYSNIKIENHCIPDLESAASANQINKVQITNVKSEACSIEADDHDDENDHDIDELQDDEESAVSFVEITSNDDTREEQEQAVNTEVTEEAFKIRVKSGSELEEAGKRLRIVTSASEELSNHKKVRTILPKPRETGVIIKARSNTEDTSILQDRETYLAQVQIQLADKFINLQRESSQRAAKLEQEQMRMEQTFLENWRLSQKLQLEHFRREQRAILERWRSDQKEHEERMLTMFTSFITQTSNIIIKKD